MITQVRTARPQIMLGGQDYYSQLAPYLLRFQYTDSCDGKKTDDCQFDLADRDRKFINEWMPAPGATFNASIICERWFSPNASPLVLPCGTFYIDSIEFDLPAHTVSVKANAIPNDTHGKVSNETKGWGDGGEGDAGTSLRKIADQIATKNHLHLDWRAGERNPQYDRIEQVEESAFQFLKRHAEDAKLEIKIAKGDLIVYDPLTLDQQPPKFTLVYGDGAAGGGVATFRMSGGRFRLQVTDLTAATTISNADIGDGMTTTRQFDSNQLLPGPAGSPTSPFIQSLLPPVAGGTAQPPTQIPNLPEEWHDHLNWNSDVKQSGDNGGSGGPPLPIVRVDIPTGLQYFSDDSAASDAALTKAQARTREKNKRQYESDIVMSIGNPLIAAGEVFDLSGCGQFDGPWFIETVRHTIAESKYETTLHIRRTLSGY